MAVKYPGLLVPEADKHQALYQGLLGMGSALSGGPSNAPVSFAQQLGRGGQSFNKSYQDRINQSKQDQMGNQKYQMQQAQMEAQKMQIEKAKEAKKYAARLEMYYAMDGKDMYGNKVPEPMNAARLAAQSDYKNTQDNQVFAPKASKNVWVDINGKATMVPEAEALQRGLSKWQKSDIKSPARVTQDIAVAEATAGAKPLTADQSKSGGYALRMYGASDKLTQSSSGPDGKLGTADDYVPTRQDMFAEKLPGGNSMITAQYRQYKQAQDDWISANLRKESGAVIGIEEMVEERKKYFPQPGDKAPDVKQKYLSRRSAEAAMKVASGKGYNLMKEELGGNPYAGFEVIK